MQFMLLAEIIGIMLVMYSRGGSGAHCIKLLPEKNSGYFNNFFSYGKVNGTNHADLSFSPVKVLCNGPQDFKMGGGGGGGGRGTKS